MCVCACVCVRVCMCVSVCDWNCMNLPSTHKRHRVFTPIIIMKIIMSLRLNYKFR